MSNQTDKESKIIIDRVEDVLKSSYDENEAFNAALDEADDLHIPSLYPDREPYHYQSSEVLFWVDRNAYNDELENWTGSNLQEAHQEAIRVLTKNDQSSVFYDLVEAIRRHRIAPFVGAGMSCSSGYPLWGDALSELASRLEHVPTDTINALDSCDYLRAAQLLWEHDETQVKNYLRTKFAENSKAADGIVGPIRMLPSLSRGCIVTTNYDSVIELVIGKGNLEGYMHGTQRGNKFVPKLIKGDRCILKLHGDAEDHDTYVFSETQYSEAYCLDGGSSELDFSKPLPRALRQIYISHSLLFLGCSLEQDKTLDLFKHVCEEGEFEIPDHFAILAEPTGGESKTQKENRLLSAKIRPIWYPPEKHHYVAAYLQLALDMVEGKITKLQVV